MSRAAEFCYIAERSDGAFLLALGWPPRGQRHPGSWWTRDADQAMRITEVGRMAITNFIPEAIGFRRVLAG